MGQIPEAKSSDILEHSPDDEIEGEIVYLQSRLLNGVLPMKQRYGKGTFLFFCELSFLMLKNQMVWVEVPFFIHSPEVLS